MNKIKWISFGIGALAGILATSLVSGRPSLLRTGTTAILSRGIGAKRKVESLVEVAKENISDLIAEADQKVQERQAKSAESKES